MGRKLEEELIVKGGEMIKEMLENCETSLALTGYSMQDFKLMDPIDAYLWSRRYMFAHGFKWRYGKGFYQEQTEEST